MRPLFQKKVERFSPCVFFVFLLFTHIQPAQAQCCIPENNTLKQLVQSNELQFAHVGVYVYDDSSKKVIADYQSDKYFVPASNTKLFSLYAGMKYLGDSLVGIAYWPSDSEILIKPMGDPSLLHPDFQSQPVIDFLKKTKKKIVLLPWGWQEKPLGPGWAWDDYNEDYSVERSPLPVYGNFIRWYPERQKYRGESGFGETTTVSSSPDIPWKVNFAKESKEKNVIVKRALDSNLFTVEIPSFTSDPLPLFQDVPFVTNEMNSAAELLKDTLGKSVSVYNQNGFTAFPPAKAWPVIYSRPVDSVFTPMMYRSDNFFAEQTLLMSSQLRLGYMKEETIIDSLLTGPLSDLPQKPNWVDGSGLSRYNLFTPQDFVKLLIHFKNEFGMDRMKRILPTGGSGTIKNYYKNDSGSVYMKTGSMTGVLCISGYLYTNKKHLLEFSILVNNHNGGSSAIRRQVETFVESIKRNN